MTLEEYQAQQAARKAAKAAAPKVQQRKPQAQQLPEELPQELPQGERLAGEGPRRQAAEEPGEGDWEAQADGVEEEAVEATRIRDEVEALEELRELEREASREAAKKEEESAAARVEEQEEEEEEAEDGGDVEEEAAEKDVAPPASQAQTAAPAQQASKEAKEEDDVDAPTATGDAPEGGKLLEPDIRPHVNVVFIGHVDAGKSTTCGNILYLSGCVDERTIEKYMKEAKDKNRESWFLAYIMDTSDEEKAKGKTVEVGRAHFETPNRRFTILDAPGHKSYVPNMIAGASQADIGVLIISARKGEFETGFERGGQTREHATLAKTLGVDKLVVAINKMDDNTVEWQQERYDEIVKKLTPFLKSSGFKDDQLLFLPMSGLTGDNIKERKGTPDWFTGKSLLDLLDSVDPPARSKDGVLRIPMLDGFKDEGAIIAIGKVEQGTVRPGMKCVVMPIGHKCTVKSVYIKEEEMQYACAGENVTLKMANITEAELTKGFVLCIATSPVRVVTKFKAQLHLIELPEERPVLTSGYKAVLHVHVAAEECEILKLYESMSMTDRKKKVKNPTFVREGSIVTCSISLARPTSVDTFTGVQQLGRFTLRDEGRTIAIGKITELPKDK